MRWRPDWSTPRPRHRNLITVLGELVSTFAMSSGQFILGRAIVGIGMAGLFGMAIGMILAVTKPDMHAQGLRKDVRLHRCRRFGRDPRFACWCSSAAGAWGSHRTSSVPSVSPSQMFAIPENKASKRRAFDYKGVILAAAALLLFMYGLWRNRREGLGDPVVLLCIFGGLALGVLFVWVEKREPDASFPLAVFKIPAVVAATVALVAAGIAQGSAQANLTELMQTAGGYSSSMVSIIALPMVIFGVIGALLTGSMVAKGVSVRLVLVPTVGLMAVGILVLVFISPRSRS